jgi:protein-S-isoprenylcysteine O-methyltransferase Ste14
MYVGALLALIGEFTMFGTPVAAGAIYIAIFLAAVNLFIRWYEEPALLRRFGPEYAEYCRRVPRWIGRRGMRSS